MSQSRVPECTDERKDLRLVEVPDTALRVDVVLDQINDLFLAGGDGDEAGQCELPLLFTRHFI